MAVTLIQKILRFSKKKDQISRDLPEGIPNLWVFLFASILVVVILCQIVYLVVGIPVFRSFGWKMFDIVGTNVKLIRTFCRA